MTDLEGIAVNWLDRWREKTKEEDWKFSEDESPARFTNHYRRQNKIDGFVADQLHRLKSRGDLDQEARRILTELQKIDGRRIFGAQKQEQDDTTRTAKEEAEEYSGPRTG